MKVTKYNHACLLVEEQGKVILIDPGNYSEPVLDLSVLASLDTIIYTHEHQDHFYIPLLKSILAKFPDAEIVANNSIKELLKKENISVTTQLPDFITEETAKHEQMLKFQMCPNIAYTLFNTLTHPGDSLSFTKTARILALPVQAPWGSTTWAVEKAIELKPEVVLPIHDWHWRDEARVVLYGMMENMFATQGIRFIPLENGKQVEV